MEEGRNPVEEKEERPVDDVREGVPDTHFQVTRLSMVYRYLFITVLTLVGAGFLFLIVPSTLSAKDYPLLVILAIWVLALLRYWVYLLDMPHRIECQGPGTLRFFSLLRRREILLKDVVAIKTSPIYPSYVKFLTSKKKTIPMINHVTGLHVLTGRIREANPDLETKGF